MNEAVDRKVLSVIMDFIHSNHYIDLDNFASKLAHRYCELIKSSPSGVEFNTFFGAFKNIRTNFFIINRVKKVDFAQSLLSKLGRIELPVPKYNVAQNFATHFLEIGYDKSVYVEEREKIISSFRITRNPHEKVMKAFEILLQKITKSFQISLHGTKEYSGIDISKVVGEATIGFQIKSINDDISEVRIRAQASKALEFNLDGFAWIYGRPRSRTVESSIQAAYHHFRRINEVAEMYCVIIEPELLAELFRKYKVTL